MCIRDRATTLPIVLDADALNLISRNKSLFSLIPKHSILTPHPKEFERLFGSTTNDFERNELQRKKSKELNVVVILKGAHSCISTPSGDCYFNASGSPAMATGGSGDVLTGIITGLLAQGYSAKDAAILGVYLHGKAGELAAEKEYSLESVIAGDLVACIGKAYAFIRGELFS